MGKYIILDKYLIHLDLLGWKEFAVWQLYGHGASCVDL